VLWDEHGTICTVLIRATSAEKILAKNAELNARVKMLEYAAAERLALQTENQRLKDELSRVKAEMSRTCETNVLLKEE
jgi:hypothetical protein